MVAVSHGDFVLDVFVVGRMLAIWLQKDLPMRRAHGAQLYHEGYHRRVAFGACF